MSKPYYNNALRNIKYDAGFVVDEIVEIINTIYPLYLKFSQNDSSFDVAKGSVFYYSPGVKPGYIPDFVNSMTEEVFPDGFPDKAKYKTGIFTHFKFYKYNTANSWKRA